MKTRTIFKVPFDAQAPMRVDEIVVKWEVDPYDCGDDRLGSYSDTPGNGAIDRQELGDMGRHEYRYFNPANYDPEHPEYALENYNRAEALNRGEWCFSGCIAEAEVSYPIGQGSRRIQRFTSGGLWGIESDSDTSYFKEVEQEQLDDLKDHLAAFNVPWPDGVTL